MICQNLKKNKNEFEMGTTLFQFPYTLWVILVPIENMKHSKIHDPMGQAWQNGRALAA